VIGPASGSCPGWSGDRRRFETRGYRRRPGYRSLVCYDALPMVLIGDAADRGWIPGQALREVQGHVLREAP
jgi:hypothetical protein